MQVPTTRLFTAGEVLTGAMLNQTITSSTNFFLGRPIFYATQTVAQALTIGGSNAITFTSEVVDRDSGHSTTTNTDRYTAATPGWYRVSGVVAFAPITLTGGTVGSFREARIAKNGTTVDGSAVRFRPSALSTNSVSVATASVLVYLNGTTDYVQLVAANDATASATYNTSATTGYTSSFTVEWVSL